MPNDLSPVSMTPDVAPEITDRIADGEVVVVTGVSGGPFMLAAAETVTSEVVNLMATHARGLVGIALRASRADALGLEPQPRRGWKSGPDYTLSIEAAQGTTTGISAEERAITIRAAVFGGAADIVTPGHIFPQVCDGRGTGAGDCALRLVETAGRAPVAVICTMLDASGNVAGSAAARALADRLGLGCTDAGGGE
ncbi:3,4-dihydroxy-2-butanone 4-phosphate synthase / GTP cyclohydrolase II [Salipiger mucosus DSM 16094]|uniref:3,4-dihydroxy-2-butanone 4-phosphate synthase n=2 Tax=Salipiger mucosus TaxID=263378 RepID=S9RET8_9RHOB|nr:3,4-dihydroxy-2-butanone 4-phosphate synthase / GTP cyclohydrolase II [Salipiger mucosus DSM 16094]